MRCVALTCCVVVKTVVVAGTASAVGTVALSVVAVGFHAINTVVGLVALGCWERCPTYCQTLKGANS